MNGVEKEEPELPPFALYLGNESQKAFLARHAQKETKHAFAEKSKQLRRRMEALGRETEADGWQMVNKVDGAEIWKKEDKGGLITKGVAYVENYPPALVFAVIVTFGTRAKWDTFFETGRIIRYYDRVTSIGYAAMKGVWPVASRDTVVISVIDRRPDGSLYQSTASVDIADAPPDPNRVRAELDIGGWILTPVVLNGKPSTKMEYYVKIDLKGSLPSAALKVIATQTPLCVARIRNYVIEHGPPPLHMALCGDLAGANEFDHDSSKYVLNWHARKDPTDMYTEVYVAKERYPNGFNVTFNEASFFNFYVFYSSCFGWEGWSLRWVPKENIDKPGLKIVITKSTSNGVNIKVNGSPFVPTPYQKKFLEDYPEVVARESALLNPAAPVQSTEKENQAVIQESQARETVSSSELEETNSRLEEIVSTVNNLNQTLKSLEDKQKQLVRKNTLNSITYFVIAVLIFWWTRR